MSKVTVSARLEEQMVFDIEELVAVEGFPDRTAAIAELISDGFKFRGGWKPLSPKLQDVIAEEMLLEVKRRQDQTLPSTILRYEHEGSMPFTVAVISAAFLAGVVVSSLLFRFVGI